MRKQLQTFALVVCIFVAGRLCGQDGRSGQNPASHPAVASTAEVNSQSSTQTVVPRLIKLSGNLQDLSGKPITGAADVTFSLYAVQAGGAPLWFESQTVQADALGNYNVLLGAMTPTGVPMELFTDGAARWLGVQVANLPEQSRVLLVSVPYAMKAGDAETLGGRPASQYQLAPDASAASDSTARGTAKDGTTTTRDGKKSTKNAQSPVTSAFTTNYIPVYSDNTGNTTNSIMVQSGTKIGINTNAPAFNLDLNGAVFAVGPKAAAAGQGGTMRFRDDTGTQRWLFGLPGSAGSQDFFMYNYTNGHSPLYIQGNAASYSVYMNNSGNVGIGTTSPAAKLDVAGAINASSAVTATTLNLAQTTSSTVGVINMGGLRFIHNCCLPGQGNIFMGLNAGNFTMTGSDNTVVGNGFQANTTGMRNVAIGAAALYYNGTGSQNTAVGASALYSNGTGSQNTAAGLSALYSNQGGVANTSIGFGSMFYNTNGNNNTAVGYSALYANTTGSDNTAIGLQALHQNTTGTANTATGRYTLSFNTTGGANTADGEGALGANSTGNWNIAVGTQAMSSNTTGSANTAVGPSAMLLNTTGGFNAAVGNLALRSNTNGSWNSAFGPSALYYNCSGISSTCAGNLNVGVGYYSGVTTTTANANVTGQNDTYIGSNSGPASATQFDNATAIGAAAVVGQSNALVLGSINGVNGATSSVNVGIGTSTPSTTLQVAGGDVSTTTAGKGIIVKSPDGTKCARISIDNSGQLVAPSVTCP